MPDPQAPDALFVGLMSGTSMDGIDAALVRFGDRRCHMLASGGQPYPRELQSSLREAAGNPDALTVDVIGQLDQWVGDCFAAATRSLLESAGVRAADVCAIGSHGQTLRHRPDAARPFTLQIGDPNRIAAGTGITTVADFRRRDMAAGGQGAPLAPAFHAWLFGGSGRNLVVLNLGGIANVTWLPADGGTAVGFDTGPGNTLLDAWARRHTGHEFDDRGTWSASGHEDAALLAALLADPYFEAPPPKSTGFEHFNAGWLEAALRHGEWVPADVQATLVALTAVSVRAAIRSCAPGAAAVIACGGGVHNDALMARLARELAPATLETTAQRGLDPDLVEAAAFAWLARQALLGQPGNLPAVTGASRAEILGGIYLRTG